MNTPMHARMRLLQPKLHGLAVGMTLAIGSTALSQGCPLVGQCSACGACLPRLPLLAMPLVADAIVLLAGRVMEKRSQPVPPGSGASEA